MSSFTLNMLCLITLGPHQGEASYIREWHYMFQAGTPRFKALQVAYVDPRDALPESVELVTAIAKDLNLMPPRGRDLVNKMIMAGHRGKYMGVDEALAVLDKPYRARFAQICRQLFPTECLFYGYAGGIDFARVRHAFRKAHQEFELARVSNATLDREGVNPVLRRSVIDFQYSLYEKEYTYLLSLLSRKERAAWLRSLGRPIITTLNPNPYKALDKVGEG